MASADLRSLPVLPFPAIEIRKQFSGWEACIESWNLLCNHFLALPSEMFASIFQTRSPHPSVTNLLTSYVENMAHIQHGETWIYTPHAQTLHKAIFLLSHRILENIANPPDPMLSWTWLGLFCKVYKQQMTQHTLIEDTWVKHREKLEASFQKYKSVLTTQLENVDGHVVADDLLASSLVPLLRACPSAGSFLLTGSDFVDSVIASYNRVSSRDQSRLLLLLYLVLLSPLRAEKGNQSLLHDHLYNLKSDAERIENSTSAEHSILSDLLTDTPFLAQMHKQISRTSDHSRATSLMTSIEKYRRAQRSRPIKPRRQKLVKGKAREVDAYDHLEGNLHVHRMSLISQVQDLFPHLGSGYIVKLLDEYDDSVELMTAHLLEDTLSEHLRALDQTEELPIQASSNPADVVPDLAPRSTPPPSPPRQRRNIHDNDEFDRLAVAADRLYLGRKDTDAATFNRDTSSRISAKAAIMSALATFDADDDERDDTYDIADVGGTVDASVGLDDDRDASMNDAQEKNEEILFSAWRKNAAAFGRDAATRRGKERQALKQETSMTDEAIEGWAVMLQRDSARQRRLEARYATFGGQQHNLAKTSWVARPESDGEDASNSGTDTQRDQRGGYRGRGRARGRGGNVAGPSDDKGTQASRQRKEASKGSRANHNRRDQRARKMARGGGMMG